MKIKYIYKNSDVILNVVLRDCSGEIIPIESIDEIDYVFFTNEEYSYNANIEDGKIYIPSNIISNFQSGILKYNVHIALSNEHFEDGKQDIYYNNKSTNIYIK